MINGKKIGLVLSGGGSKGLAHIGVLKVLEQNGIIPDIIVGTSMGSIVGGLYASGMTTEQIENETYKVNFGEFIDLNVFNIFKQGIVAGKKLIKYIDKISNNAEIENFKIKFACVACDIIKGKPYIFGKGKLSIAVRCSSAIPGVFSPYRLNDKMLVDGGVINNRPCDIAKKLGADYIISVDAIGSGYIISPMKSVADVLMSSFNILQYQHEKLKPNIADVNISLNNKKYRFDEHTKIGMHEIIKSGEIQAKKAVEKIKNDLSKLNQDDSNLSL